jgi:NAD(P)-dependent dehydrogenase (short-subunit alcohol dehydrogenase family)
MAGMLNGKVIVVTGAGGGIGQAIAVMMAEAGAAVIINDIGASLSGDGLSTMPAERTKAIISQRGGRAEISTESVAGWDSARLIIQSALDHFGRIDGVVNNAGVLRDGIFHRMSEDDWNTVIAVHLGGCFFVSRAAAEHFRKQESGSLVHITSTSGLIGNVGQANYAAAKLGIVALSKSIALDMQRYNVRSNCLSPWAWSRMTNSIPSATAEQKVVVEKLRAMGPEKNAPLSVALMSDAAKGVSGQVFGTRMNELYLFSSARPVRSVHHDGGWTPEQIAEIGLPALRGSFMPLDTSEQAFPWDPV